MKMIDSPTSQDCFSTMQSPRLKNLVDQMAGMARWQKKRTTRPQQRRRGLQKLKSLTTEWFSDGGAGGPEQVPEPSEGVDRVCVGDDTIEVHICDGKSALGQTITALLESGCEKDAITKAKILQSAGPPSSHPSYSGLLAVIGSLPNLRELCIKGHSVAHPLAVPSLSMQTLLQDVSQTLVKLCIEDVCFLFQKIVHINRAHSLFTSGELESLVELEIRNCFWGPAARQPVPFLRETSFLGLLGLLGPLAPLPSLTKVTLHQGGQDGLADHDGRMENPFLKPRVLRLLLQSSPLLEELAATGFAIKSNAWQHIAKDLLSNARNLKKLHLDRCSLDADSTKYFLGLLGPQSPLEDFEFLPIVESAPGDRLYGALGTLYMDSDAWGNLSGGRTGRLTWRKLLANGIPRVLQNNTQLKRLRIKVGGGVNVHVPVDVQQSWLDVMEEGGNTCLQQFAFTRTDGLFVHYEDAEIAAKFDFYQKRNCFDARLSTMKEEGQLEEETVVQLMADESGNVSCLYHYLLQCPTLCER